MEDGTHKYLILETIIISGCSFSMLQIETLLRSFSFFFCTKPKIEEKCTLPLCNPAENRRRNYSG